MNTVGVIVSWLHPMSTQTLTADAVAIGNVAVSIIQTEVTNQTCNITNQSHQYSNIPPSRFSFMATFEICAKPMTNFLG